MNKFSGLTIAAAVVAVSFAGAGSAAAAGEEACRVEPIFGLVTHSAIPAVTESRGIPAVYGEQLVPAVYEVRTVPAVTEERLVPAVTEERVTPAVYATEYEYIQRASQEGQPGQGAGTRWEAAGWNADSNPNSNGWIRTGAERQVLVTAALVEIFEVAPAYTETVVLTPPSMETVVLVPEVPGFVREEVVGGNRYCEPAAVPSLPAAAAVDAPAPVVPVAVPEAVVPAELAYTGAAEDALVAAGAIGGMLLLLGSAAMVIARPRRGAHRMGR